MSSSADEPLIFEVDSGPSFLGLVIRQFFKVNYLQLPMILLILFYFGWTYLLLKYRNDLFISSVQFLLSCFFIYISATVNSFMSDHWRQFYFSENYFDPNCIFAFVFWALPFTCVALVIIFTLFIDLCKSIAVHRYFDSIITNNKSDAQKDNNQKQNEPKQNDQKQKTD